MCIDAGHHHFYRYFYSLHKDNDGFVLLNVHFETHFQMGPKNTIVVFNTQNT